MWPFKKEVQVSEIANMALQFAEALERTRSEMQSTIDDLTDELHSERMAVQQVRQMNAQLSKSCAGCQRRIAEKELVMAEVQELRARLEMKKAGERQDAMLKAT
jgi:hypothetical protein